MKDRILIVLTSHDRLGDTGRATGFYVPEAAHPWRVFTAAGYQVDLVSVLGGTPPMDGLDETDPVQRAFLTDPDMRAQLAATRRPQEVSAAEYRAIFYAGGHGAMWDLPDDVTLGGLARDIYQAGGVVAAVCHGPAGLVNVALPDGRPLVSGRAIAGFSNTEEHAVGLTNVVPFLLVDKLAERGARYHAAGNFQPYVVTDGRLVTGQNPASATGVAEAVVRVLRDLPAKQESPIASTWVDIPIENSDITMSGYLARPVGGGRHPGVVIGHQLFGVDVPVRQLADRVAAAGFVALAPDLYHRVGPRTELPMDDHGRRRGFELLHQLTAEGAITDIAAAMAYVRQVPDAGPRTAMIGLSVGGHLAYLAASELDLAATVAFYPGWLASTALPFPQPQPTLARTPGIAKHGGRLLLLVGENDHVVTEADQQQIAEALRDSGVRHHIITYPDTPHGFFVPGTGSFRPGPAADAWQRLHAMLTEELSTHQTVRR